MDSKMNVNLRAIYNTSTMNDYLYVYEIGTQECMPDKPDRIHVFEYTTIHFVFGGEGYVDGKLLSAGQGFVVRKGEIVDYGVNPENPWTYFWMNLSGSIVDHALAQVGIEETKCIFEFDNTDGVFNVFKKAFSEDYKHNDKGMLFQSYFFELMSVLGAEYKKTQTVNNKNSAALEHYYSAMRFISNNYAKRISVNDIARIENIERHYLDKLFLTYSGKSPSRHLFETRMEIAGVLLKTTDYSIGTIGLSVGYSDQLQFSKAFKKYQGVSPRFFRESFKNQ